MGIEDKERLKIIHEAEAALEDRLKREYFERYHPLVANKREIERHRVEVNDALNQTRADLIKALNL